MTAIVSETLHVRGRRRGLGVRRPAHYRWTLEDAAGRRAMLSDPAQATIIRDSVRGTLAAALNDPDRLERTLPLAREALTGLLPGSNGHFVRRCRIEIITESLLMLCPQQPAQLDAELRRLAVVAARTRLTADIIGPWMRDDVERLAAVAWTRETIADLLRGWVARSDLCSRWQITTARPWPPALLRIVKTATWNVIRWEHERRAYGQQMCAACQAEYGAHRAEFTPEDASAAHALRRRFQLPPEDPADLDLNVTSWDWELKRMRSRR
jgi:hypothetical protein